MNQRQRNEKRWKRENRSGKGERKPLACCRHCGHKLSRFGCPSCNPNIGQRGEIRSAMFLAAALSARRRS